MKHGSSLLVRCALTLIALLMLLLPTGCIGEETYDNTPRGNFEALWQIIDQQYCFLDY